MQNRKETIIVLIVCLVATISAAAVGWYLWTKTQEPQQAAVSTNDFPTDAGVVFEESAPAADPLIVGKWQNTANPLWYKVYYDDFDEDEGAYWGKEWDEADDVQEEDLNYHGNGWFRWEKRGDTMIEYATMDARDVPIAKVYKVVRNDSETLSIIEQGRKNADNFVRVSD